MTIRIVKMTFREEEINNFRSLFDQNKSLIRSFEGVEKLELYQDSASANVFFTYSVWKDAESLENYRQSDLFKSVWSQTKQLFSSKAEAWSVNEIVSL